MSDWQNDWLYKWIFKRVAQNWNEVHTAEEGPERFAVVEYASSGSSEPQGVGPIERLWFYDQQGLRLATDIEKREYEDQWRRILAAVDDKSSLPPEEARAIIRGALTPPGRLYRQACITFRIGGDRQRLWLSECFGLLYGRGWVYEVTGEGENAKFRGERVWVS